MEEEEEKKAMQEQQQQHHRRQTWEEEDDDDASEELEYMEKLHLMSMFELNEERTTLSRVLALIPTHHYHEASRKLFAVDEEIAKRFKEGRKTMLPGATRSGFRPC